MSAVFTNHNSGVGKNVRHRIGHHIGNDKILLTHPYQVRNIPKWTFLIHNVKYPLMSRRQVTTKCNRYFKSISQCSGQVHWNKGGTLRVTQNAVKGTLLFDNLVQCHNGFVRKGGVGSGFVLAARWIRNPNITFLGFSHRVCCLGKHKFVVGQARHQIFNDTSHTRSSTTSTMKTQDLGLCCLGSRNSAAIIIDHHHHSHHHDNTATCNSES
mmetsp:Transcript_26799/g.65157  ORF Transcript_26799/g.65157 Transcript_26799/m.65157 type:complete len:212 (+) Transcript_26799:152-787(+)